MRRLGRPQPSQVAVERRDAAAGQPASDASTIGGHGEALRHILRERDGRDRAAAARPHAPERPIVASPNEDISTGQHRNAGRQVGEEVRVGAAIHAHAVQAVRCGDHHVACRHRDVSAVDEPRPRGESAIKDAFHGLGADDVPEDRDRIPREQVPAVGGKPQPDDTTGGRTDDDSDLWTGAYAHVDLTIATSDGEAAMLEARRDALPGSRGELGPRSPSDESHARTTPPPAESRCRPSGVHARDRTIGRECIGASWMALNTPTSYASGLSILPSGTGRTSHPRRLKWTPAHVPQWLRRRSRSRSRGSFALDERPPQLHVAGAPPDARRTYAI